MRVIFKHHHPHAPGPPPLSTVSVPVVGEVLDIKEFCLDIKWLEGEPNGFHHVAARHCGDAWRRT